MNATGATEGLGPAGVVASARGPAGVNDFAVSIATANGTGTASVNGLLLRAVFRMGVPVSGKNLFPSNIEGLPTWYELRVNAAGHTARVAGSDLLVAMNPRTFAEDVAGVRPGGYVLYDASWPPAGDVARDDVGVLAIPFTTLMGERFPDAGTRLVLRNVAYLGALVALLAVDEAIVRTLLDERFARRERLRAANEEALELGLQAARACHDGPLPFHVQATGPPGDDVLLDGNTAAALGCVFAGATVAAWYPLTPSTSVMDHFGTFCRRYRRAPEAAGAPDGPEGADRPEDGNRFVILQAEDELAALGMVLGAGWNGARAFTATSGPGISLMAEQLGLAYYAEIPAVVIEVQRAGPSTGMPTRTQQADLLACAYASHGDTRHLVLLPSDPRECFEDSVLAFDLAERYQTPVIVCSDLDIGMNDWVVPKLTWDDGTVPDRGRVLTRADVARLERFFRYDPPDDHFVAARTLPGTSEAAAYFTRGSGHDRHGAYTESPGAYQEVVDRLADKHRAAALDLPPPVIERRPGARTGVIAFGSSHLAVAEALSVLAAAGEPLDYLRVRAFPFHPEVGRFLDEHDGCIVVEQNRDGQLRAMLAAEVGGDERLASVRRYGGLPLTAAEVLEGIAAARADHRGRPADGARPAGPPGQGPVRSGRGRGTVRR